MLTSRQWLSICLIGLLLSTSLRAEETVTSQLITTDAGELVLQQSIVIHTDIDKVWHAYTTAEGWMMWAAPLAEVDLKNGGKIQTNYNANAQIGDKGTNTLTIVNYVPKKLLTLQAELSENWPEVMKQDAEQLMNVIIFDDLGENTVRISSYGVGYQNKPEYKSILKFFIPANEGLMTKLKAVLEQSSKE